MEDAYGTFPDDTCQCRARLSYPADDDPEAWADMLNMLRQGCRAAFETLFADDSPTRRMIDFQISETNYSGRDFPEDPATEVLIKALRSAPDLTATTRVQFGAWVKRIAINKTIDLARKAVTASDYDDAYMNDRSVMSDPERMDLDLEEEEAEYLAFLGEVIADIAGNNEFDLDILRLRFEGGDKGSGFRSWAEIDDELNFATPTSHNRMRAIERRLIARGLGPIGSR